MYRAQIAFFVPRALAICGLGLALPACEPGVISFVYTRVDAGADAEAGTDDGPAPPEAPPPAPHPLCEGECLPGPTPVDWYDKPVLLWLDDSANAPTTCPDNAPTRKELFDKPISTTACHTCICGEPACVLPEGLLASSSPGCMGPTLTSFPAALDGSCSMAPPVQSSDLQSLALLPPTVSPCTPSMSAQVPEGAKTEWGTKGVVCTGEAYGSCEYGEACVPAAPSGFRQCIMSKFEDQKNENMECPQEGEYGEPHVLYRGINEKVACNPCTCGPPSGTECTAAVSAYQNKTCAPDSAIFKDYVVPLGGPLCSAIGANMTLAGMSIKWITNQPGACTPKGGDPSGKIDVEHTSAILFCCKKEEDDDVPK